MLTGDRDRRIAAAARAQGVEITPSMVAHLRRQVRDSVKAALPLAVDGPGMDDLCDAILRDLDWGRLNAADGPPTVEATTE